MDEQGGNTMDRDMDVEANTELPDFPARQQSQAFTPSLVRQRRKRSIETSDEKHYHLGYPEITHQIATYSGLQLFRRFKRTRMRLILTKQDRIVELEDELDSLDSLEMSSVAIGSIRNDANTERVKKLKELDDALAAYDSLVQRTQWALNAPHVQKRHVDNLKNVLEQGNIDRAEMEYRNQSGRELMYIGVMRGGGMDKITPIAEFVVEAIYTLPRKLTGSHSEGLFSISKPVVRGLARALAAAMTILILLVPIIILNFVNTTVWKFVVIFIAAALFVSGIAAGSTAGMGEIFVGGATYAAVLVVFVSQNEISNST